MNPGNAFGRQKEGDRVHHSAARRVGELAARKARARRHLINRYYPRRGRIGIVLALAQFCSRGFPSRALPAGQGKARRIRIRCTCICGRNGEVIPATSFSTSRQCGNGPTRASSVTPRPTTTSKSGTREPANYGSFTERRSSRYGRIATALGPLRAFHH